MFLVEVTQAGRCYPDLRYLLKIFFSNLLKKKFKLKNWNFFAKIGIFSEKIGIFLKKFSFFEKI